MICIFQNILKKILKNIPKNSRFLLMCTEPENVQGLLELDYLVHNMWKAKS